jgi:hypothetical protein
MHSPQAIHSLPWQLPQALMAEGNWTAAEDALEESVGALSMSASALQQQARAAQEAHAAAAAAAGGSPPPAEGPAAAAAAAATAWGAPGRRADAEEVTRAAEPVAISGFDVALTSTPLSRSSSASAASRRGLGARGGGSSRRALAGRRAVVVAPVQGLGLGRGTTVQGPPGRGAGRPSSPAKSPTTREAREALAWR